MNENKFTDDEVKIILDIVGNRTIAVNMDIQGQIILRENTYTLLHGCNVQCEITQT